ncbi:alanine and proline-rich secreted protein Apa [Mycobacterium shimoidei]|uniref:alanine and proline-rich secreted protein Apa n=1 Tax=Mycobacterium shimoidei TaxID=29313 RepID=UPI000848E3B9|nr:alanine and proline-rich secreted protein Apa [Mycobacterium shimoidei]MCV7259067.1 hypothetical protein [Mycobacterium shimoidei]ODR13259.1 hypothetical protein BHQ16_10945 [Mycobacterium shimoidei]ORW83285.1 hypothetical protein AWC26_02370 [Mycobacterium shimoidei]
MEQVDPFSTWPKGFRARLAGAALAAATAVTIVLPATTASADPVPPPAPAPSPGGPNAAPDAGPGPGGPDTAPPGTNPVAGPVGIDPNAPPPVADPNAPEPGRIGNAAGGFSYVLPAGWVESDASHLDYGSALLSKEIGPPPAPNQPPVVANDTRIVLGKLDQKLYASAESDNTKAASRLASDMGEFFMPYPGTRINQASTPLNANGVAGSASYYEVRFSDTSKPNGQIWTGVVGAPAANATSGQGQRWFVVWLGTANDPVDQVAAKALAESIRPFTPPPAPAQGAPAPAPGAPAPAPGAPAPPPAPGAPAPAPAPEVPTPVPPPGAPAPNAPQPPSAPAPAAEQAPITSTGSTVST